MTWNDDAHLVCKGINRRLLVKKSNLNGIDYVEVAKIGAMNNEKPTGINGSVIILVYCFKALSGFDAKKVLITGGNRIKKIKISFVGIAEEVVNDSTRFLSESEKDYIAKLNPSTRSSVLVIKPEREGDFSTYKLRLIAGPNE